MRGGGGGGGTDLFFCSTLPNALYLITKQTSLFYSYSKENTQSTLPGTKVPSVPRHGN